MSEQRNAGVVPMRAHTRFEAGLLMRKSHWTPAIAAAGLAIVVLTACGSSGSTTAASSTSAVAIPQSVAGAPTPPQSLVDEANKEGTVVVYVAPAIGTGIEAAFQKTYPGIKVNVVTGATDVLATRYQGEAAAGAVAADDIVNGYSTFFDQEVQKGALLPVSSVVPNFASLYPANEIVDSGQTALVYSVVNGFAYNTDLVPADKAPKSIKDLAQPYWQGHLVGFDPKGSVSYLQFYDMVRTVYGDQTLSALGKNIGKNMNVESFPVAAQNVAAGEAWATILTTSTTVSGLSSKGAPIKYVVPTDATGAVFALGVSAKGPHPAAAKLFAYWALSKAGQTALSALNASTPALTGASAGGGGQGYTFHQPKLTIDATETQELTSLYLGSS
jgi:iron(III) transport system substrate-binding protein